VSALAGIDERPVKLASVAGVIAMVLLSGCAFSQREVTQCTYDDNYDQVAYSDNQPEPQACIEWAAQFRRKSEELEAKGRKEADQEAERKRQEAVRELLRESPVQCEQGLVRDLQLVDQLHSDQQEALRDAVNHVILTKKEERALRSVSLDQWHALSQLAVFYKWLND
jgi:hypothetical protein